MRLRLSFLLSFFLLIIDQLAKWWVEQHPFFVLKNQALLFGFGPTLNVVLWIILCLILITLLFTIEKPVRYALPTLLIIAGVLSNLIDRIWRGGVIDYLHLSIGSGLFFNLADISIIVGIVIYGYQIFRHKQRRSNPAKGL